MKLRTTGAVMRQDAASQPAAFRQDESAPTAAAPVVLLKLDGKEYVQGSAAHVAALDAKIEKLSAEHIDALKAKDAEIGTLKAKLDAVPAQPDTAKLIADELAFRDAMRKLLPADYKFDGKSREDVRFDAVGADVATKVRALPEGQREGYLQAMLDQRAAAADRPTHAPVKTDAAPTPAPTKFDPYAKYNAAFKATYGEAK